MKYKFEDFILDLKESVDRFEIYWKEKNKKDPINWPMELEDGDWFEQFLIWNEDE